MKTGQPEFPTGLMFLVELERNRSVCVDARNAKARQYELQSLGPGKSDIGKNKTQYCMKSKVDSRLKMMLFGDHYNSKHFSKVSPIRSCMINVAKSS